MKNKLHEFKKGYYRPVSMPIWKMLIVYMIWGISLVGYILAMFKNPWFIVLGVVFQFLGFQSMLLFDNGNWKNTKEGREYFNKYYGK